MMPVKRYAKRCTTCLGAQEQWHSRTVALFLHRSPLGQLVIKWIVPLHWIRAGWKRELGVAPGLRRPGWAHAGVRTRFLRRVRAHGGSVRARGSPRRLPRPAVDPTGRERAESYRHRGSRKDRRAAPVTGEALLTSLAYQLGRQRSGGDPRCERIIGGREGGGEACP